MNLIWSEKFKFLDISTPKYLMDGLVDMFSSPKDILKFLNFLGPAKITASVLFTANVKPFSCIQPVIILRLILAPNLTQGSLFPETINARSSA